MNRHTVQWVSKAVNTTFKGKVHSKSKMHINSGLASMMQHAKSSDVSNIKTVAILTDRYLNVSEWDMNHDLSLAITCKSH